MMRPLFRQRGLGPRDDSREVRIFPASATIGLFFLAIDAAGLLFALPFLASNFFPTFVRSVFLLHSTFQCRVHPSPPRDASSGLDQGRGRDAGAAL